MSHLILKDDLFKKILLEPARQFDELCIVSGFATPAMVVHHLSEVKATFDKDNLRVRLIVGMTPGVAGMSKPHHKNFTKLVEEQHNFVCSYLKADADPTHTKLYTWLKDGRPQAAFVSSANYTLNAFRREQDEVATECDPEEAYRYFQSKDPLSLYCTCPEALDLVREEVVRPVYVRGGSEDEQRAIVDINKGQEGVDWVRLPLFSERQNRMHEHSGLNWGQRDGREPNQAYIPVPIDVRELGFFPPRGEQFSVLTDDGFPFVCVIAQDGGKAIHTTNNNSEFGEYFRNRLGVALSTPITLKDLDRFGSRYVKFTKINEEEYYMEFDPN
ncbi:MAG: NgoFVII family restriction endonuclease [Rickettsiales bacterium]|jgi:hypothetical protein|nr:NgoFVII family restriction endonuclease [Rickettsiales bacterium]